MRVIAVITDVASMVVVELAAATMIFITAAILLACVTPTDTLAIAELGSTATGDALSLTLPEQKLLAEVIEYTRLRQCAKLAKVPGARSLIALVRLGVALAEIEALREVTLTAVETGRVRPETQWLICGGEGDATHPQHHALAACVAEQLVAVG